ncbi:hypothetical protein CPB86DRAFT_821094 [Serendipita vermifera]|nr:hypothetical protein CPB86DRAFT_821094 [Serendipita vermifera]
MSICSPNQYSKTDSLDSAIHSTPPELWWDILDQVLYYQLLFSTIYQGIRVPEEDVRVCM